MKAVATALVLIAGAAVVLWYANFSNSWILGGLIGGFAALLISIPISLVLFSYLARHHAHHFLPYTSDQEQALDDDDYPYVEVQALPRLYRLRDERFSPAAGSTWEEDETRQPFSSRYLPASPTEQAFIEHFQELPPRLSGPARTPATTKHLPAIKQEPVTPHTQPRGSTRQTRHPSFPGYQPALSRSQLRSQALRTARLEAMQQNVDRDNIEELSFGDASRLSATFDADSRATDQPSLVDETGSYRSISTRSQYGAKSVRHGERRVVDSSLISSSPQGDYRSTYHAHDPQTDHVDTQFTTDDIQRPLVRRAPYTYDDDPIRKQLSQHLHRPITRRSSRKLSPPDQNE